MRSDYFQPKHHRGSYPPLQEAEQGIHQWIQGLRLMSQQDNPWHLNNEVTDRKLSDKVADQQDKDDEARWQDDGGEGG
jgi:hypothetical protein